MSRHSVKTGYEFQRIETEVQDVNPLYGRDTYNGSFTRPAGAAASNLYNLADFMLGLRAQYALSNVLIANLRQHMHFLYAQDDWRISDRLSLNLGLRYEYATPHWETGQHPVELRSRRAQDGASHRWIAVGAGARRSRPQQLRTTDWVRLDRRRADGRARRLRHQLHAFQSRRRRQHPSDQRAAIDHGRREPERCPTWPTARSVSPNRAIRPG